MSLDRFIWPCLALMYFARELRMLNEAAFWAAIAVGLSVAVISAEVAHRYLQWRQKRRLS